MTFAGTLRKTCAAFGAVVLAASLACSSKATSGSSGGSGSTAGTIGSIGTGGVSGTGGGGPSSASVLERNNYPSSDGL